MFDACNARTAQLCKAGDSATLVPGRRQLSARTGPASLSAPEAVELIVRIAESRDRQAFAALFAYYFPRVKAYLLRTGVSSGPAEELAQETMLRVWRKADRFNPNVASVSTWIFIIARNLRIDRLRDRRSAADRDLDPSEAPDLPATGESIILLDERRERVRKALGALSEDQARIVELFFFEDRPHSEIAEALGLPLGTVKSRIRLAIGRLRLELGDLNS